tara:strand:+ start:156 stop:3017 length:2862 start_codon:yes stop_codon:yes gene_type:complete
MATTESLILQVKSDSVAKSTDRLDKFSAATKKADRAQDGLTSATKKTSKATTTGTATTDKNTRSTRDQSKATTTQTRATREAEKAQRGLSKANTTTGNSIGGLIVRLGGLTAAMLALKGSVSAAAELETLETSLVSITGSASNAKATLKDLTDFTAKTPFQLEGVAAAAKQLITAKGSTQGLKGELKLLGDLSATVGVPIQELAAIYVKAFNKGKVQAEELNQISERGIPIIRLLAEEYGITSAEVFKLGEQGKISFTDLQNVLQKTTQEGGLAFGAMERQSETFNGTISTLKDNIKLTAGEIGALIIQSAKLKEVSTKTTELLEAFRVGLRAIRGADLKESLEESEKVLSSYNQKVKTTAELVARELDAREKVSELTSARIKEEARHNEVRLSILRQSSEFTARDFDKSKESLAVSMERERSAISVNRNLQNQLGLHDQELRKQEETLQLSHRHSLELAQIKFKYEFAAGASQEVTEEDKRRLIFLEDQIAALGDQVKGYQNITAAARVATSVADVAATKAGLAFSKIEDSLKTRRELIGEGFDKQIAGIDSYAKALKEAGLVDQAELDRVNQARERATSARSEAIEGLAPRATTTTPGKPVARRSTGGGASRGSSASGGASDFESLVGDLKREEVAIEESYLKRIDLVRNNTAVGSVLRAELTERVREEYEKESASFAEKAFNEIDISAGHYSEQLDQLQQFYDRRKEIILASTILTEEEKNAEIARLNRERSSVEEKAERERWKRSLEATQDFLGDLSSIQAAFGKRGAKIAKAAAIANATIDTARNAILAYQRGLEIPVIGTAVAPVFAAAAIAAGVAQIATIKSQSVGNYAQGGILGGGSSSGDSVTFNGNRGEAILNFEQQKRLLNIANGSAVAGQGGGSGNVTIINQTSRNIDVAEQSVNSNGERQIIIREAANLAKAELVNESETGSGSFVPSLQRNFGLRRQGA